MLIMAEGGLKVPKRAVFVEVHLREVGVRRLEIFLAEQGRRDPRPESVVDRFEDDELFLPGRDADTDAWMLVNKDAIVWASVPVQAATLSLDEELFDHRRAIQVELMGGALVEGDLLYSAPGDRARSVDYLNRPGRFLRMYFEDGLALVNKRWIICARETADGR
jgi:hypothetical protein